MKRHRSLPCAFLIASMLALLPGCGSDRVSGNSVETENTVALGILPVDSFLPEWNRPASHLTVATLRFDARNFDFSRSSATGRGLRLERMDSTLLPFEIVFWDSTASRGRLRVRLDSALLTRGSRIRIRSRLPQANFANSQATWQGIPDAQRLSLTSVLVDDFEHGTLWNRLPDSSLWYSSASESCSVSSPFLVPAGHGRTGNALAINYRAPQQLFRFSLLGSRLGTKPNSLRSLDSLVFWARGSGSLSAAFDHLYGITGPKSWKSNMPLDTAWRRIRIRPEDLDPADGVGDNYGWKAVRDSVTHLTFLVNTGSELVIDNVRLYGIDRDDLH